MAQPKPEVISITVEDQTFQVNKDILCENSDYFRAMFSGNFSEQGKNEIRLNVVDANSMAIIIRYMTIGIIDITEIPLPTVGELAISANFLQVTELIKQIEYSLEQQLTMSNWLEIKCIAEQASYKQLEERSAAFGLYNFELMRPEYIQSVHTLVWYLSHSHLNVDFEIEVFKFGLNWFVENDDNPDAILLVLYCLDMKRIGAQDLSEMKILIKDYQNSLLEAVITCLHTALVPLNASPLTLFKMMQLEPDLTAMYSRKIYKESFDVLYHTTKRELKFKPCVAVWPREQNSDNMHICAPHYLYMLENDKDIDPWLEVAEKNLWGWKFAAWGVTKIVVVCGELGRGTGNFWRAVKVYDTLRKEWTEHGVRLPCRRHGAVAIKGDSLYLIGGVGAYRVVLDTAVVYNLKERTHRKIANIPDAVQSPAACVHDQHVYATGHKNVYRYDDEDKENDKWVIAVETDIKLSWMVSYKGYIYCVQSYFDQLYRFRPNVDDRLEFVTCFASAPSTMCNYWDKLLAFESGDATQSPNVTLEEYSEGEPPRTIWREDNCSFIINDVAGSCAIVNTLPPLTIQINYLDVRLNEYLAGPTPSGSGLQTTEEQVIEVHLTEQISEVQPTEQTTEVQPTVQTTEVQPTEEQTINVLPSEEQTIKVEPTEEQTIKVEPTEEQTTKVQPTEKKTIEMQLTEQTTEVQLTKPTIEVQLTEHIEVQFTKQTIKVEPTEEKTIEVQPTEEKTEVQTRKKTAKVRRTEQTSKVEPAEEKTIEVQRTAEKTIEVQTTEKKTIEVQTPKKTNKVRRTEQTSKVEPTEEKTIEVQPTEKKTIEVQTPKKTNKVRRTEQTIMVEPSEEKTIEVQPTEKKTIEVQTPKKTNKVRRTEQTIMVEPSEEKTIEVQPTEKKTIEVQTPKKTNKVRRTEQTIKVEPTEEKTIEVQPTEEKTIEVQPRKKTNKVRRTEHTIKVDPTEEKNIEVQSTEKKTIEVQPTEQKPIEVQPTEEKTIEAQPRKKTTKVRRTK